MARAAGRHLGVADMAEQDVELDRVLAAGRGRLLEDAHPQRREAQLRVAHEVEQLLDRWQGRGQRRHGGQASLAGLDGEGRAVPEACIGHRAGL